MVMSQSAPSSVDGRVDEPLDGVDDISEVAKGVSHAFIEAYFKLLRASMRPAGVVDAGESTS